MNIEEKIKKYNFDKIVSAKVSNLLGISAAIICDGKITDDEIKFLQEWLWANDEFLVEYPLDKVKALMKKIMSDGIITEKEKQELLDLLNKIAVNPLGDPVNNDIFTFNPKVVFNGKNFVITGQFLDDSRETTITQIEELGGIIQNRVTKETNYVVVGSLGSESWKHGNFGLKIRDAIKYQKENKPIQIVKETDMKLALLMYRKTESKFSLKKLFGLFTK